MDGREPLSGVSLLTIQRDTTTKDSTVRDSKEVVLVPLNCIVEVEESDPCALIPKCNLSIRHFGHSSGGGAWWLRCWMIHNTHR